MICRHRQGDPECSSYRDNRYPYDIANPGRPFTCTLPHHPPICNQTHYPATCNRKHADDDPGSPDSANYSVEEIHRTGRNLVLKVKYPNCAACNYEGNKILVYLNVTESQVLKWRKIDPHFKDPKKLVHDKEAPPPVARFPASKEGWLDAIEYAKYKEKVIA